MDFIDPVFTDSQQQDLKSGSNFSLRCTLLKHQNVQLKQIVRKHPTFIQLPWRTVSLGKLLQLFNTSLLYKMRN